MKLTVNKDGKVFYVTITDDKGDYELLKIQDHDELLSVIIDRLGIQYP